MVNDGNKGDSFVKAGSSSHIHQQNLNLCLQKGVEGEEILMETEGFRSGFSDMYRNSSEELFLKSLMETSVGVPVPPTMEMLGFKNLSHNFRTDSEELFRSWLTNGENQGCNSSSIAHRTRQASRRISTELTNQSVQQQVGTQQRKRSNDVLFTQTDATVDEASNDINQQSIRNAVEKSMQASNLYLAKAWFNSTQPMTRSRSSELRRRYAAMQNAQTNISMEAVHNASGQGLNNFKQEFTNLNGFGDLRMNDVTNQLGMFMSPSNSSSSTFNAPHVDNVSSVVNMLKGTLERKKLGTQIEKETEQDIANAVYRAREAVANSCFDQVNGNNSIHDIPVNVKECQAQDIEALQNTQGPVDLDFEGFVNPVNPIQFSVVSREPSQSESSAAAPVVSPGFDACDGPSYSSQTPSICESSRKQVGNSSSENGSRANKEFRERIIGSLKEDRKRGGLTRYGSITSTDSVDKGDPTKKRRVERSRKMAEAKERNSTPSIPTDTQSVLKRCENLEKEVRSLKLNLSFMNRKDSEQTKQIEELQKRNEELADEKERLLEEIERILSETGKI